MTKQDALETLGRPGEYEVYTDDEAQKKCYEVIRESLWAFNAKFIIGYTNLPDEAIDMIKMFCAEKCESANDTLIALVGDRLAELVYDAIGLDGRGHFLATYDGHEIEHECYFFYRVN